MQCQRDFSGKEIDSVDDGDNDEVDHHQHNHCLDLLAIGIGLPKSDAVLLGHVPALRQQLRVRDCLLTLRKILFVQFVEKHPKMR